MPGTFGKGGVQQSMAAAQILAVALGGRPQSFMGTLALIVPVV